MRQCEGLWHLSSKGVQPQQDLRLEGGRLAVVSGDGLVLKDLLPAY